MDRELLVWIKLRGVNGLDADLEAVLDTGFSEFLTLPKAWIDALAFPRLFDETLALADGSAIPSEVYDGLIVWDGQERPIPVHRLDETPLLGMAMLWDQLLAARVTDGGAVSISPLP